MRSITYYDSGGIPGNFNVKVTWAQCAHRAGSAAGTLSDFLQWSGSKGGLQAELPHADVHAGVETTLQDSVVAARAVE